MNATTQRQGSMRSTHSRLPHILFASYGLLWVLTALKPHNRQDWLLENVLVFVAVPALVVTFRWFHFSNVSYLLMTMYLSLHAIGAYYTYSEMPIFNWLRDDWQFNRNHYDRLVHFLFGLLISYPLWEWLVRVVGLRHGWARVGTVHVIMAWSAAYEIIEAAVAHLVSPELGAAYNGIQGDIWDAQKDAALAMTGAVITMTLAASWSGAIARGARSLRSSEGQP
jgi:putative membrane protein